LTQVFEILKYQIETKIIFSVVGMLTSLRRYKLKIDNLEKLVMIMKNWLVDA
jgi:hypothetical protein